MANNETLQMTHNQYMEFLKNNASRLYSDKRYTMADYNRDAERVEIVGFDLDRFGFSDKQRTFIDKVFSGDREDKFGNLLLEGHLMDGSLVYTLANVLECGIVKDKCYSGFFKNDDKKCVLEFCEGDIYLALCDSDSAYREVVEDYNKFYQVEPTLDDMISAADSQKKDFINGEWTRDKGQLR